MRLNLSLCFYILVLSLAPYLFVSCEQPPDKSKKKYSTEQINKGETLLLEARCGFCHTPVIETSNGKVSDTSKRLSGHPSDYKLPEIPRTPVGSQQWLEFLTNLESTIWADEDGVVFSANITPDNDTGIGKWTEEMFINTIRTGKHPGWKKDLKKPMPWLEYSKLSNDQLISIYAYLMSIKPVYNKVPEPITFK